MPTTSFLVGAYASLPEGRDAQKDYYNLLGAQPWINGAEMPYPGDLIETESRTWLARTLPAVWHHNSVTAIPGTMQHVWKDAAFGLASPDEEGRQRALGFVEQLRLAVVDFAQLRGSNDIAYVEIHAAPTKTADADALRRSLDELKSLEWAGARLLVEHCDRFVDGRKPEKGFLPIESEIDVCREAGVGMTVNWGRSSVEGRDALTPLAHVQKAGAAGVLTGLMFSGAGPAATQYGYEWIDGHLPMNPDEPTSLMGAAEVEECAKAALASDSCEFMGAKVCVPKTASLEERLSFLERIHSAAGAA
jgi:hypothetical protein